MPTLEKFKELQKRKICSKKWAQKIKAKYLDVSSAFTSSLDVLTIKPPTIIMKIRKFGNHDIP